MNVKKWSKKEAIEKKLKSMVGRRPFADVIIAEVQGVDGNMTLNVSINEKARKKHEETLGRIILFTNRENWFPEAIIWGYRE